MSKKHRRKNCYCCCNCRYKMYNSCGSLNIYSLAILILILLQFCRKNDSCECKDEDSKGLNNGILDKSILFIITLFLLISCSCNNSYFQV